MSEPKPMYLIPDCTDCCAPVDECECDEIPFTDELTEQEAADADVELYLQWVGGWLGAEALSGGGFGPRTGNGYGGGE